MKNRAFIILILLAVLVFLGAYIIRSISSREIDDVSPAVPCSDKILMKSDILWVVPVFENVSIVDYPEWCEYILGLNKSLGLHGVHHTFEEFDYDRNVSYLNIGANYFEKCFGFKPNLFKPPHLALSEKNKKIIEKQGYRVKGKFNQIIHKVYHCGDSGRFSNKFIDLF